jgi:D-alanyl-D-alanine endopeptidase (penicillin-binding protein 7)
MVASAGPGSPGQETDLFGPATKAALAAWQATIPALVLGEGSLGPATRRELNALATKDPERFSTTVSKASRSPTLDALADGYPRQADEFAAAVVVDVKSGKTLYEHQADKVWSVASLSKLATAMVAIDLRPKWAKVVALARQDEVGGGRLRVGVGTRLTVKDLFYTSLVGSANNTTMALARQTGLSAKAFVARMNKQAKDLGLSHTEFHEPSGMDPKNRSTAREMATLATAAFAKPDIKRAASDPVYEVRLASRATHTIRNTNALISSAPELDVVAGKTGYLEESMYNLVTMLEPETGEKDRPLMVVVFGGRSKEQSFASARALANWAWKAYDWPSTN